MNTQLSVSEPLQRPSNWSDLPNYSDLSDLNGSSPLASSLTDKEITTDTDSHPGLLVAETEICPASSLPPTSPQTGVKFWQVFGTTFITIFLAELGDKTQVSTLLMSAEFHNPQVVFMGAGLALIATSLLGVLVGRWLSSRISPTTLDRAAGTTLALIAVWLVWDVVQM